jgi:DNA-binding MarR family transcriptional regulator
MSVQAIDWALRLVKNVTPTQKLILICLANHAGPDGTCWPSQSVISEYTELSRETIYRNLSDLEKRGLIRSIHRRDQSGRDLSKTYVLNLQVDGES